MVEVELRLNEREMSILVNSLQKEGLSIEEASLLRKLSDRYKDMLTKIPPTEA